MRFLKVIINKFREMTIKESIWFFINILKEMKRWKEKRILIKSGLFNPSYYLSKYPDVRRKKICPYYHFIDFGWKELRNPHVLFDTSLYIKKSQEVITKRINPVIHFLKSFRKYGVKYDLFRSKKNLPEAIIKDIIDKRNYKCPDPNFDVLFYTTNYKDIGLGFLLNTLDPYTHYLEHGIEEGRVPSLSNYRNARPSQVKNDKEIKISVIIPVYKSEKYIRNCIESVLSQSIDDIEIIIVNDGSPDNAHEIIQEIIKDNPNIQYILHETNSGLVQTHIDGIKKAKGKYFTILDGDDWLDPYFCEILYDLAEIYNAELVSCWWSRPDKVRLKKSIQKPEINNLRILKDRNILKYLVLWYKDPNIHYGLNRKLILRDAWNHIQPLQLIDKDIIAWEDGWATLKFCTEINTVVWLNNELYNWFRNPDSIGSKPIDEKYLCDLFRINKMVYENLDLEDDDIYKVYIRHLNNTILDETYRRMNELYMQKYFNEFNELLILFGKLFDENKDKYPQKFYISVLKKYSVLYCKYLNSIKTNNEYDMTLIDSNGIADLAKYYIPYCNDPRIKNAPYFMFCIENSLSDILDILYKIKQSKIIITSGGWNSNYRLNKPMIQVWHGMGAIKAPLSHSSDFAPTKLICSSENVIPAYKELFPKIRVNDILPIGSIQADYFLNDKIQEKLKRNVLNKKKEFVGKKVYFWCPTFRGVNPDFYLPEPFNFHILKNFLNDDEIFLYRLHPALKLKMANNKTTEQQLSPNNVNIFDVSDEEFDEILSIADVFITDYSSAIHYAILKNIPVVLYAPDHSDIEERPSLHIDYKKDMPGEILFEKDEKELVSLLRKANSNNQRYDNFKKDQLGSCDGKTSERLVSVIDALLSGR